MSTSLHLEAETMQSALVWSIGSCPAVSAISVDGHPVWIVEEFYSDPDFIRSSALASRSWTKGSGRYPGQFLRSPIPTQFYCGFLGDLLGVSVCPSRQYRFAPFARIEGSEDVHLADNSTPHWDDFCDYVAVVYLSKENGSADLTAGTSFWKHVRTGRSNAPEGWTGDRMAKEFRDQPEGAWSRLELVQMRYNRMVVFPASVFHRIELGEGGRASSYSRLTQNLYVVTAPKSPSSVNEYVPLSLRLTPAAGVSVNPARHTQTWFHPVLMGLATGICMESDLIDFAYDCGGASAAASAFDMLQNLKARGAIAFVLHDRGRFLAEASGNFAETHYAPLTSLVRMSPFAFMRPGALGVAVGTATRGDVVYLSNHVAKHVLDLSSADEARPVLKMITFLHERLPAVEQTSLHALVSVLLRAGVLLRSDVEPRAENGTTGMWEFHDLLFHTRTTQGHGSSQPQGATYRFSGRIPSPPAIRAHNWPRHVTLERCNEEDLAVPFREVLQLRRSPPDGCALADDIHLGELGRFLSTLAVTEQPTVSGTSYDVARRLYPGAGACYELEVFPLVVRCRALERGLYYYDAREHSLHRVKDWGRDLDDLAASACQATGRIASTCVVLLLSARFERLAWKYEGIAYSLCLKDVGVLFDFMYSVAAALGLEVCALGSAEAGLFSRILGDDPFREPLVGQFLIVGRRVKDSRE